MSDHEKQQRAGDHDPSKKLASVGDGRSHQASQLPTAETKADHAIAGLKSPLSLTHYLLTCTVTRSWSTHAPLKQRPVPIPPSTVFLGSTVTVSCTGDRSTSASSYRASSSQAASCHAHPRENSSEYGHSGGDSLLEPPCWCSPPPREWILRQQKLGDHAWKSAWSKTKTGCIKNKLRRISIR
jgi:hypothetical protein